MKRTTKPGQPKGPLGNNPKGNYFHAMYPVFEKAFWHLPAKERLFWWIYRMTFGFFNKRDRTYRLCTAMPPGNDLPTALRISPPNYLYTLITQLRNEDRILRWHHKRTTWLAISPLPLRETVNPGDLAALLALTPGPHLRVTKTGEIVDTTQEQPQDEAMGENGQEPPGDIADVVTMLKQQHRKHYPDYTFTDDDLGKGLPRAAEMLSRWHTKRSRLGNRHATVKGLVAGYTTWIYAKAAEQGWDTPPHGGTYSSEKFFKEYKQAVADGETDAEPEPIFVLAPGGQYRIDEDGHRVDDDGHPLDEVHNL